MSRARYFRTCPTCGAALDPGEVCEDCRETNSSTLTNLKESVAKEILTMGFENVKFVGELDVRKAFEMRGRISGARYGIKATLVEVYPKSKKNAASAANTDDGEVQGDLTGPLRLHDNKNQEE